MTRRRNSRPTGDAREAPHAPHRTRERTNGRAPARPELRDIERLARFRQQARRMAHDFRNLLLVADTRVELAQMDSAGNSSAQQSLSAARAVLSEAREMTSLLDGLARDMPLDGIPTNLSEVVRRTTGALRAALPDAIDVIEDVRLDPPVWIRGDAAQLSRLIRNLVLNARDAMPHGGTLAISLDASANATDGCASSSPGKVWLEIADTGVGMAPATRGQVFEPFFTTKHNRCGTGLGLPIVKEIADAHGASIELDSTPGAGTRFRIVFPAFDRVALGSAQRNATEAMVLVVGADHALRTTVGDLRRKGDLAVGFADTGWQALRVLEREHHAVQCLMLVTALLPAEDVAMLRALRCWRGRRGVVLLVPADAKGKAPITSRGECVLSYPYSAADFLRSVECGMHAAN